jgi:dihydroorotate dehydrogenase (fumarate)
MTDLRSTYMGIPLRNPIIVGASGLTSDLKSIHRLAEMGAGALVTKSLFEEQITMERFLFDEDLEKNNCRNPEMISVHPQVEYAGPAERLMWVKETKKAVDIPVIASLNAVHGDTWVEYARRLEDTGVDGLECNFFASPAASGTTGAQIEDEQMDWIIRIRKAVGIPISVKLSPFYGHPASAVRRMADAGASGLVLFNRFFEPDIDIESCELTSPFNLSHDTDYRHSLRYAGLLEGETTADLCCSTGIFTGREVIKMILAGAQAIQTVSALYRHGPGHIRTMLSEVEAWMAQKGYATLADFRGKLSRRHLADPWAYTRAQYARLLMNPRVFAENVPSR